MINPRRRRHIRTAFAFTLTVWLALAFAAAWTPVALADEPVRGTILVPVDHVDPGGTIPISGYGLDRGALISMTIEHGTDTIDLGQATVAADGSMSTTAILPETFPLGYAELAATSSEGGSWEVSVLVGSTTPAATPPTAGMPSNLIALAAIVLGLAIFLTAGWRYLRR